MINAVIFDMDGLLIDSEPLWNLAMQQVFATIGVDISPELAAKTTGLRTREVVHYWQNYFKWECDKTNDAICDEIIEAVTHKIINEGKTMEGLHYILDFFQSEKMKIGLASSSPLRLISSVLEHLNIRSQFEAVYSAEFEPYGKPHPAVYLSCAQELGVPPMHCLAFEDSVNGMVAAKAARMKVVAVPEAHNRNDRRYGLADLKLDALTEFTSGHFEQLRLL